MSNLIDSYFEFDKSSVQPSQQAAYAKKKVTFPENRDTLFGKNSAGSDLG